MNINTTAVANNLSITGQAMQINNVQSTAWAPVYAFTNVSVGAVGGAFNVSGTAVGNNVSVKPGT